MRLSKFQRAKLLTSTSAEKASVRKASEKASVRKACKVLLDAGFLSARKATFIYKHYK